MKKNKGTIINGGAGGQERSRYERSEGAWRAAERTGRLRCVRTPGSERGKGLAKGWYEGIEEGRGRGWIRVWKHRHM